MAPVIQKALEVTTEETRGRLSRRWPKDVLRISERHELFPIGVVADVVPKWSDSAFSYLRSTKHGNVGRWMKEDLRYFDRPGIYGNWDADSDLPGCQAANAVGRRKEVVLVSKWEACAKEGCAFLAHME